MNRSGEYPGKIRGTSPVVRTAARALRREGTFVEKVLWHAIRDGQLDGFKFRRQHPVGRFVLDFFCPARNLVVELDGEIHNHQLDRDAARTSHLAAAGYQVLRFRNEEVLSDLPHALDQIRSALHSLPSPKIGRGVGGEGRPTLHRTVTQVVVGPDGAASPRVVRDTLAVEEPLEIRVVHGGAMHPIAVTMRTPGADFELAAGFLFGEGLIQRREDVVAMRYCVDAEHDGAQQFNIVNVHLRAEAEFDSAAVQRNFGATSSCGVCGKASIEAVMAPACLQPHGRVPSFEVNAGIIAALPATLRAAQPLFDRTGGLHAAALFAPDGELIRVREDVGRHNAMDKLVGAALLAGEAPLRERIALMSGRLSFELVQKAARAGIAVLAGVSAPSSLAVELAERAGMTLAGFVRDGRFNLYTGPAVESPLKLT